MKFSRGSSASFIRWCNDEEIGWVNEQYDRINFKPSSLDTDRIAVATCNGERVGIGRLCHIKASIFELGGMYVQQSFRGFGISRKIIKFLLEQLNPEATVYCLPFAHLRDFYESQGFKEVPEEVFSRVPRDILEKQQRCNETYPHEVLLLKLNHRK